VTISPPFNAVSDLVSEEVVVQASCYRSMRKNEEPHTLQVTLIVRKFRPKSCSSS